MADTKLTALSELSVIDLADDMYVVDDTGPTSYKIGLDRVIGLVNRGVCQGRLTLTTGVPVTTTDVIGATTLYWTPMDTGLVTLYDGSRWVGFVVGELSLALSGLTSAKAYDAFLDWNSGTPALVLGTAWTDGVTRAVALAQQNGIYVLNGTTTKRYVGTIYTTGTTTTEDSAGTAGTTQVGGKRFVWNLYNRRRRALHVIDTTANTYGTASFRQVNAAAGDKVEYVCGLAEDAIEVRAAISTFGAPGTALSVGIGIDSTTVNAAQQTMTAQPDAAGQVVGTTAAYAGVPGLGYHAINWLEKGAASGTPNLVPAGLIATVQA